MSVDPVAVMAHRDRVLYGRDDPVTMVEDDIPALVAEVERLRTTVDRVRALHASYRSCGDPSCNCLPYCESCVCEWPCDTSRALGEATDD